MKKIVLSFLVFFAFVAAFLLFFDYSLRGKASKDTCAFCDPKIIEKQKFYEDDLVFALYDVRPICEGHCVLVPKRHVERLENLSVEEMSGLFQLIKKTQKAVERAFDKPNYLILQKNGASAGQTVPHVHIHFIPRKKEEFSLLAFLWNFCSHPFKKPLSQEKMDVERAKLRKNF